jgi:hypothetical protein
MKEFIVPLSGGFENIEYAPRSPEEKFKSDTRDQNTTRAAKKKQSAGPANVLASQRRIWMYKNQGCGT